FAALSSVSIPQGFKVDMTLPVVAIVIEIDGETKKGIGLWMVTTDGFGHGIFFPFHVAPRFFRMRVLTGYKYIGREWHFRDKSRRFHSPDHNLRWPNDKKK